MRFKVLVAPVALGLLGAVAWAAGHPKATGTVDFGGPGTPQILSFNAHDLGATGDKGSITYTNVNIGLTYSADVFCAKVDAANSVASFAYQIPTNPQTTSFGVAGLYIVFRVTDGGSPGAGNDTIAFGVSPDQASAVTACESLAAQPNNYTITGGNLVVHAK